MADVKFCKDCKWCVPKKRLRILCVTLDYHFAKCAHISAADREPQQLVDGTPQVFCSSWRAEYENRCGPEGKYWEPR